MQDSCYKNEVTCKVKDTKGGGRDPGLFLDRSLKSIRSALVLFSAKKLSAHCEQ